jgi:hypothetical protein
VHFALVYLVLLCTYGWDTSSLSLFRKDTKLTPQMRERRHVVTPQVHNAYIKQASHQSRFRWICGIVQPLHKILDRFVVVLQQSIRPRTR